MSDPWTHADSLKQKLKETTAAELSDNQPMTVVAAPAEEEEAASAVHDEAAFTENHEAPQQDNDVASVANGLSHTSLSFHQERVLVVDTNALLFASNLRLEREGTEFYTTPGIIAEIKDSRSRAALSTLPFQLKLRTPITSSILEVKKYALKTGDYTALSANDMAVLALAYELEMELNGKNNCITPPPEDLDIKSNGSYRKIQLTPYDQVFRNGEFIGDKMMLQDDGNDDDDGDDDDDDGEYDDDNNEEAEDERDDDGGQHDSPSSQTSDADVEGNNNNDNDNNDDSEGWTTFTSKKKNRRAYDASGDDAFFNFKRKPSSKNDVNGDNDDNNNDEQDGDFDEEEDGWVTPSNVTLKKRSGGLLSNDDDWATSSRETNAAITVDSTESTEELAVAATSDSDSTDQQTQTTTTQQQQQQQPCVIAGCTSHVHHQPQRVHVGLVTTDFAMQNVILHMGIDLVSNDGKRVRELKRWVKRCESCSCLVTDMMRQFCPLCGNSTLRRITCYIDDQGNEYFLYNPKSKTNLRGTIFRIPRPRGGRRNNDPVLCEDETWNYLGKVNSRTKRFLKVKHGLASDNGATVDTVFDASFSFENTFGKNRLAQQQQHKAATVLRSGTYNGFARRNPNEGHHVAVKKKKGGRR